MDTTQSTEIVQDILNQIIELAFDIGPNLLLAVGMLVIGFWLIKKITNLLDQKLSSSKIDKSIAPFLKSLISATLKVMLLIAIASTVGIDTTSFVAIIGAITFAIGFALQGSLGNFAGGLLILIFKPFKVGDIIEAQGFVGYVEEIQVFKTTIIAVDRKTHLVPNGPLSNGNITNLSTKGILRVSMKAWVGYDADIALAKKVALEVLEAHPLVEKEPKPKVRVFQLEKDAVVLGIHPFSGVMELWDVYFEVQEQIVIAFQKAGISIPHQKFDVSFDQGDDTVAPWKELK